MMAESEGIEEPLHYGESLGICAGDIGFFLAFEILAKIDVPSRIRQRIQETWSAAFTTVGLAQMQDMFLSGIHRDIGEDDIIDLYRTKTASYTFSLPLVTGAIAAGVDQATTRTLDQIGAYMGIAFQIKDDELDLFGTEGETGKPVGTDMEEGKKTLYHHHLLKLRSTKSGRLENGETEALQCLASGNIMDRHVVSELRRMAEKHGIRVRVRETMNQFSKRAEQMTMTLSADETYRDLLLDVLHYNTHRRG
jgi:geranylgeranyl pyrophosphate synthase